MKHYLYRVQITEYPAGALAPDPFVPEWSEPDPDWKPEGWDPSPEYIARFGSRQFHWPTTNKEWKSRSSAMTRKKLIESYGAKAIVQRSSEIVWPSEGFQTIGDELVALAAEPQE